MMRAALILPGAVLAASLAVAGSAQTAPDGARLYNRCAACHTASGKGVPGAYPPLAADYRKLAAKPAGRRYLVLAITRGLNGPISVDGKPYRGTMPAQGGMNDAAIAAVLNHIGTALVKAGPKWVPFTEAEVAQARASGAGLTGSDVAKLHAAVGGK